MAHSTFWLGSTFFEHLSFVDELSSGVASGPNLADGLWSVAVGAAAQLSIERGAAVDVAEVLPADFDSAQWVKTKFQEG